MTQFFQFESDFVASLRCIPMQVRLKLDTCGVKLKLVQWNQLAQDDRQQLIDLPCETEPAVQQYRTFLHQLVLDRTGSQASDLAIDPHPAWLDTDNIPAAVQTKAKDVGVTISPGQWSALTPLQRFALIKLSRSSHENSNFLPALKEFQIGVADAQAD
ncbi:nitrate reductase associated protein [Kovacikia minuta CCNUW1]|uniref:nitrate reductase associated protein n=1 Tax=Kovacikia minuta TaxID=2931930 RepID=UPI001CCDFA0B|nr:nitrate reductase associated protein [Kovacikia minuta]UBF26236.1 nitrate reductase associated protein [Kovacikia minuta CCNUW1]